MRTPQKGNSGVSFNDTILNFGLRNVRACLYIPPVLGEIRNYSFKNDIHVKEDVDD